MNRYFIKDRNSDRYWLAPNRGYTDNISEAFIYDDETRPTWLSKGNKIIVEIPLPKYDDQPGHLNPASLTPRSGPALRDYTSSERKAMPIDAGCLQYFPDALAAIARVSAKGNEKHNPGEPLHWSRGKSNDHAECVTRHRLTPDAIDPESGETHRNHAGWRLLAEIQIAEEKRLLALGIKPLSGVTE